VVVHRPRAERSDIWIGALGAAPSDAAFGEVELVQRILGHKGIGRLFMSVRETASLVYRIRSDIVELEQGPSIALSFATTQTPKTAGAVEAMLVEMERLAKEPATVAEVEAARNVLRGALAARLSQVGDIAGELVRLRRFGLPSDAHERRDAALARLDPGGLRA